MIKDADSQVIANSLIALDEILKDEGGIVTTTPMILHLLSKVSFSPFSPPSIYLIIHIFFMMI